MARDALEVITCWSSVKGCYDTVVCTGLLAEGRLDVICVESGGEPRVELLVCGNTCVVTLKSCVADDTGLSGVTKRDDEATGSGVVSYAGRCSKGVSSLEVIADVVISLRGYPRIYTSLLPLGNAIHSRMAVGVSTIGCVLRKVGDKRTPSKRCVRVEFTVASLSELVIDLRYYRYLVVRIIGSEVNGGPSCLCGRSLLCSDNDNTIGSAHSVKGGSSLSLKYVHALDVVRVDID